MKNRICHYSIAAVFAFIIVGLGSTGAAAATRSHRNMSGGFNMPHTSAKIQPERGPEKVVGSGIQCACDDKNAPKVHGKSGQTDSGRKARPAAVRNRTRKL